MNRLCTWATWTLASCVVFGAIVLEFLRLVVIWGAVALAIVILFGCSSFKLGAMAYCPHGQACALRVVPPEVAASGVPL